MRSTMLASIEKVRMSYWFIPGLMAIAAVIAALSVLAIDAGLPPDTLPGLLYGGTPDGARQVLSTIASSMITVAGVVFSMMIVALVLASQQFGPRLLRTFMRDVRLQFGLGTFVATFLFCLFVLRGAHNAHEDSASFVPQVGVSVALLLAVASIGVLIYFVHYVALKIQAPTIVAAVARDLNEAIDQMYPADGRGREVAGRRVSRAAREEDAEPPPDVAVERLASGRGGYVQAIDYRLLMRVAVRHDLVLRIEHRPGQFVTADDVLLSAWPAGALDERLRKRIARCWAIGSHRTLTQDVQFAVEQLVEVAVRALSPGINDPFTAMACIDRLGEALSRLAGRRLPSPFRGDDAGRLRIVAYPVTFQKIAESALDPLRQYGSASPPVILRLLEALAEVARHAIREEDRSVLRQHADVIHDGALDRLSAAHDRDALGQRYEAVLEALATPPCRERDAA